MLSPNPYLVSIASASSVFPNLRQRAEPALQIASITFRWGLVRSALHSFFAVVIKKEKKNDDGAVTTVYEYSTQKHKGTLKEK